MIEHSQLLKASLNEQGRLLQGINDKCIKEMQSEIYNIETQNLAALAKTHKRYQQHNQ